MRIELRKLLAGLATLSRAAGEKAPEIPDGEPAPIVVYGSRDGRIYRAGLTLDPARIKELADAARK